MRCTAGMTTRAGSGEARAHVSRPIYAQGLHQRDLTVRARRRSRMRWRGSTQRAAVDGS